MVAERGDQQDVDRIPSVEGVAAPRLGTDFLKRCKETRDSIRRAASNNQTEIGEKMIQMHGIDAEAWPMVTRRALRWHGGVDFHQTADD